MPSEDSPAGDPAVKPTGASRKEARANGSGSGSGSGAVREVLEAGQNHSDADQTLSDADQSHSDLDGSASDSDQTSSDRDQRASEKDQEAADEDQAAADKAEGPGPDPTASDYADTRRKRTAAALERDTSTLARSESARIRDATAERRDRDADARDAAAHARERLAAELDAEIERQEKALADGPGGSSHGLEVLLRASRDRQRAAASRARAAAHREQAARDRAMAQRDRAQAAKDRKQAADELAQEGMDFLTGALRRRVGMAAIQREMDRVSRSHEPLVLAFADVDGLKAVNDTHGHAAGDELLRGVAECIRSALRPYDVIMRFGGDEFLCSLTGDGMHGIRDRFDEISAQIGTAHSGATISVGLIEARPEDSLDALIDRASHAMLEARAGR